MERHRQEGEFWVRRLGQASSGRLLYIHGLGESGRCFDPVVGHPLLAAWLHVIPDLPGYGRSGWADPPLDLADMARSLERFVPTSGHCVLVGHSMGGVIGQMMCEMSGRPIAGFVNVEGNLTTDDCSFSGPAAALPLDEFLHRGFDELKDRVLTGASADPALRSYSASLPLCDPKGFHHNSEELVELSAQNNLVARMESLEMPRLYVIGLHGREQFNSVQCLRESRLDSREFPASGHWPFIDETEPFVEVLSDFLARHFGEPK